MLLFLLAYVGGVLTILSPCILPVLPFVFARAEQPFLRSGLPLLVGMTLTFAAVSTLAAVAGGWAVAANEYGRNAALVLLALFGVALMFPALADRLARPVVALGARLTQSIQNSNQTSTRSVIVTSALLGVATGLLWAPCAGPILGLLLTGAALQGASVQTTFLLLAYALGSATSLALALLLGGRVFAAMKRSLGVGEWVRRALGVAVIVAVVAIALGVDTGVLTRLSIASTAKLEQGLLDRVKPNAAPAANTAFSLDALPVEGQMPPFSADSTWLNSQPLSPEALKGKVVLVDFWTYSCINCLRSIPYVRAWAEKYKAQGLVVIGVHTPEFAFEKNIDNVKQAVTDLKIQYPVVTDNQFAIWRAFKNQFWPAHYFIDAQGRIRHHHFGEGNYDTSERVIQQLLMEAGASQVMRAGLVNVQATGAQQAADFSKVQSHETYLGTQRAENFISPGGMVRGRSQVYEVGTPSRNQWGLSGEWTLQPQYAELSGSEGRIVYRFHARDVHLVLGPNATGKPVRFRVTIDGQAPGADHGIDVDANGVGTVNGERLYQLIRQRGAVTERTFEIHFLDPGVRAYAFTFG